MSSHASFNIKRIREVGKEEWPRMSDSLERIRWDTQAATLTPATAFQEQDGRLSFEQTGAKWDAVCQRLLSIMDTGVRRLDRAGRALVYCADHYEDTEDTHSKALNHVFEKLQG
ncbi:hypothetical protein [Flindersiella endophytica]